MQARLRKQKSLDNGIMSGYECLYRVFRPQVRPRDLGFKRRKIIMFAKLLGCKRLQRNVGRFKNQRHVFLACCVFLLLESSLEFLV